MTNLEKNIIDLCDAGQVWNYIDGKYVNDYNPFVRYFACIVKEDLRKKNPVTMSCLVYDIERALGIINPALTKEIEWFNNLSSAIKKWTNDRIMTHRALGIKNDNQ